jgi:hypothetical protein
MTLKKEAGEKHKQASKELLYDDGIRVFGREIRNLMQKKKSASLLHSSSTSCLLELCTVATMIQMRDHQPTAQDEEEFRVTVREKGAPVTQNHWKN